MTPVSGRILIKSVVTFTSKEVINDNAMLQMDPTHSHHYFTCKRYLWYLTQILKKSLPGEEKKGEEKEDILCCVSYFLILSSFI